MNRRSVLAALAGAPAVAKASSAQWANPELPAKEPELVVELHFTESMILEPGVAEAFGALELHEALYEGRLQKFGEPVAERLYKQQPQKKNAPPPAKSYWPT